MESFNKGSLRVGGEAMIIKTMNPEFSHLVGKIVVVEVILGKGDPIPEILTTDFAKAEATNEQLTAVDDSIVVSNPDLNIRPMAWNRGYALAHPSSLMPLGDDDSRNEMFEHEENPYKVATTS